MWQAFMLGTEQVDPGTRRLIDLPVSKLSNHTPITLPVHVVHGARPGPALFVSGAIHGDEIIGVEIVRRLLRELDPMRIAGTVLCVPIVNAFGFIGRSRYLPDRRDLNRCFPGSAQGPLADQMAHLFLNQIVKRCQFGIDLHSAAVNRTNLPQLRSTFATPRVRELAEAFCPFILIQSPEKVGSMRAAATALGVDVLVYEAGEGLRLDEIGIRLGVLGTLRVMRKLEMIATDTTDQPNGQALFARQSKWLRAPDGGLLRAYKTTGDTVMPGDLVGVVANPYEDTAIEVRSPIQGLIIGRTNLPIVNRGDALFHVASVAQVGASGWLDEIAEGVKSDPIFDEDEII